MIFNIGWISSRFSFHDLQGEVIVSDVLPECGETESQRYRIQPGESIDLTLKLNQFVEFINCVVESK